MITHTRCRSSRASLSFNTRFCRCSPEDLSFCSSHRFSAASANAARKRSVMVTPAGNCARATSALMKAFRASENLRVPLELLEPLLAEPEPVSMSNRIEHNGRAQAGQFREPQHPMYSAQIPRGFEADLANRPPKPPPLRFILWILLSFFSTTVLPKWLHACTWMSPQMS